MSVAARSIPARVAGLALCLALVATAPSAANATGGPRAQGGPTTTTATGQALPGSTNLTTLTGKPVAGGQSSSDSLLPTFGNRGYNVSHYDIALTYAVGGKITATTTITARPSKALSSFALDFYKLTVTKVRVDGKAASWKRSGHKLVITPATALRHTFRVAVSYSGKPQTYLDADGAQDGWIPTAGGATALGEPVGAMTWFPNNNTPKDKATYDLRIIVPKALEVAANGDLLSRKTSGASTTWHWQQSRLMTTYLAMISIGDYKVYSSTMTTLSGRKLPIWSFVDPKLDAATTRVRKQIPEVIRFEEARFGPYPFTSVGIVVEDLKVDYALETQNRPVFDGVPDTSTLVHELAHQWFGDSVSLNDWGDIWLNEGFASYTEWVWAQKHGGRTADAEFRAEYADNPAGSDLWSPAPAALKDSSQLFSDPVYTRGAMTLAALRERLGTDTFYVVIRGWATNHRYGHATTKQFISYVNKVTGRNYTGFLNSWLYAAKRPPLP